MLQDAVQAGHPICTAWIYEHKRLRKVRFNYDSQILLWLDLFLSQHATRPNIGNYDTFCVLKIVLLGFSTGKDERTDSLEIVLDYLLADIIAERAIAIRVAAKPRDRAYAAKVQFSAHILR